MIASVPESLTLELFIVHEKVFMSKVTVVGHK